jgi:DNA repair protein RecN (Recombination protein N)
MLLSLHIRNFALVDELTVQFDRGLNVLTGETGSGKSILLDAIDALLGGSVTARAIRTGSDRAVLEGVFQLPDHLRHSLQDWLESNDIEVTDELLCSREISRSGSSVRSRLRVNGTLLNRQTIGELREQLIEITGQGETTQLASAHHQRSLLDAYGGHEAIGHKVAESFTAWQVAEQKLQAKLHHQQQQAARIELLQIQLQDLLAADLADPAELELLEQEHQTLNHTVDLQQQSYGVYQLLYQSDSSEMSAADLLGKAEHLLSNMVGLDPQLQEIFDLVSDGLAQAIAAGRAIHKYGDRLEADPVRLEEVEDRLRLLKQLCRKYNSDLPDLIDRQQIWQQELQQLTSGGESIAALTSALQTAQATLAVDCATLTAARHQAALRLQQQLVAELQPLGMAKVKFEVALQPQTPSASGADEVSFMFSPNPGEPLHPLAETASGGEMSRFLLALKTCFAAVAGSSTMVFDEIDTGVSGKVTQAIADKLRQLALERQILCVTHQPIMAAMADVHFQVWKEGSSKQGQERTVVRIEQLESESRRQEIAQLAGGHTAEESIAFADALISKAVQSKGRATSSTKPAKHVSKAMRRRKPVKSSES